MVLNNVSIVKNRNKANKNKVITSENKSNFLSKNVIDISIRALAKAFV